MLKSNWVGQQPAEKTQRVSLVVNPAEIHELWGHRGELGYPLLLLYSFAGYSQYFADADDLRAWRASQHTSGAASD